jgi:RNA polymerase sigma-70 factor (ECF subfamily)
MTADSDKLIIEHIRRGDPTAWTQLIERYEGRLIAFAERRLRDRSLAEDVVQETFIGFLNSLPNYDENRDLQTYLFTIAAHKLTDQLRKLGRHPLQNMPDGQEFFDQQMDSQKGVSSIARSNERKGLESDAVTTVLREFIHAWKEQGDYTKIKVLELLFVKGWANKDVAAFLNIKEQQVANIRFAAVRKMNDAMKDSGLPAEVFPGLK